MRQDLADDERILDACNNLHRAATSTADTYINIEYSLQPLCLYALGVQHIPLRLLAVRSGSCRPGAMSGDRSAHLWPTIPDVPDNGQRAH